MPMSYYDENRKVWVFYCNWCGKEICSPVSGCSGYCSEKCRREAEEASRPKREPKPSDSSSSSYDDDNHGTGLLGIIWKVVKWVIIITIVWFVYDNYIKRDSSSSDSRTAENVSQSSNITETRNSSSSSSQETTVNYDDIKQVAYLWSDYHNDRNISRLVSLYAPQTNYYHSNYSREQIKTSKEKLLNKYPDFKQEISNVTIENASTYYIVSFDKKVWTDLENAPKTYPSYLHIKMIDGGWRIITESDLITDKNLSKKKK